MEWLDRRIPEVEFVFFPGDSSCELQQHNNKLEDVDVDRACEELLASVVGPYDIKPILEVVAIGPSTNSAGVSEARELCISGDHMADANRPWPRVVGDRKSTRLNSSHVD